MGLDTSHDCWHGPYGAFGRWRQKLAEVAGLPPLDLMEGFFERGTYHDPISDVARKHSEFAETFYRSLPIRWTILKPDVLHILLNHSDCEGELESAICGSLANRLEELLPLLPQKDDNDWRGRTRQFIDGLRLAASQGENVDFH